MNEFRNKIKDNYTTIPNELVNDSMMTWKAKGIFLYLASKPDNWHFSMEQISSMATDQMAALKSGIKELETLGYLKRERIFGDGGKIIGWRWTILTPSINHQTENTPDGNPIGWKTMRYNNTDSTKTEISNTEHTKYIQATDHFVKLWNYKHGTNVKLTPDKERQVKARLKVFTPEEIQQAIENRSRDPWFQAEGAKFFGDWESFWRNDSKVERYLNRRLDLIEQPGDLPF